MQLKFENEMKNDQMIVEVKKQIKVKVSCEYITQFCQSINQQEELEYARSTQLLFAVFYVDGSPEEEGSFSSPESSSLSSSASLASSILSGLFMFAWISSIS